MAYNFNFRELDAIKNKYGDTCKLSEDNIKDIYFLTDCNTNSGGDCEITSYLEKHFSPKDILEWNDEYINNLLDECDTESVEWEQIAETGYKLQIACGIYTDKRYTYKKIIDKLKSFYKRYGYFMNYYFLKKIPAYPYEDRTFTHFESIYISEIPDGGTLCSYGNEQRYLKNDGYCGLIPRLHKLNYADLLNELLNELLLPVLIHFDEFLNDKITDVMKKLDIIYIQTGVITDICDYPVRNLFKKYMEENGITVPDGFIKLLTDFPLTYDNAKEYFFRCKCSLDKIYNRKDSNAETFASYNINQDTLDGWTNEWITAQISQDLTDSKTTEKLLYVVHNFSDIVNADNAKKMLNIYHNNESNITDSIKRTLIYYVEINRQTNTARHYGLLYIAAKNGLRDYIGGLESEFFTLQNDNDGAQIKKYINAMYKEFNIKI